MANDMTGAILTDEQKALQELAYYDARCVAEGELRRLFSCSDADLAEARGQEFYKSCLAAETKAQHDVATGLDDSWNSLEQSALSSLHEAMPAIADPRMLLGMAVQANKAGRRTGAAGNAAAQRAAGGRAPVIDVQQLTQGSAVVRLRTRFLERLQKDGEVERMVEREAEVRINSSDMHESMNPKEVKSLLRNHLGVNPDNLSVRRHQGADQMPGLELDFGHVPDE